MRKKTACYELGRYQRKTAQLIREKEQLEKKTAAYGQSMRRLLQLSGYLIRLLAEQGMNKIPYTEEKRRDLIHAYQLQPGEGYIKVIPYDEEKDEKCGQDDIRKR